MKFDHFNESRFPHTAFKLHVSLMEYEDLRTWAKAARDALQKIRDARDYCAENGYYTQGPTGEQEFDDWAADVADQVLRTGYPE